MSFFAGKFYRNRKISSHKICEDIKVVYGVFIYIVIHLTPIHLMTEVTSILGLNCKRIAKITSTPKKNSTKNGSSLQSWHFLSVFASSVVFVSFLIIFSFLRRRSRRYQSKINRYPEYSLECWSHHSTH